MTKINDENDGALVDMAYLDDDEQPSSVWFRRKPKMSQDDALAIAEAFAHEHDQDAPAVAKVGLSWFATAMLDPDWAEHATETALRSRLANAFLVQSD